MLKILQGHVLDRLGELPAESVHCVVTSPPYFGLRDYRIEAQVWGAEAGCEHEWGDEIAPRPSTGGIAGFQTSNAGSFHAGASSAFCRHCNAWRGSLGLEPDLNLYLDHVVEVCRAIRRVLRRDGTFWLNIGDSYAGSWGAQGYRETPEKISRNQINNHPKRGSHTGSIRAAGLKPKDLMLVPARLALRLQADGWWVRSEIVWDKPAPMPESCTDRPTCAHEKVWLLTKSARYFYDAEAVKEAATNGERYHGAYDKRPGAIERNGREDADNSTASRNLRNVWRLPPAPFPEAHFATFPPELPRRAILAGTSARGVCPKCGAPWARIVKKSGGSTGKGWTDHTADLTEGNIGSKRGSDADHRAGFESGDYRVETIGWRPPCECSSRPKWECDERLGVVSATVLDPFLGSGTTALVADQLQRDCIGIELSPKYAAMAERRVREDNSLFLEMAAE